VTGDDARNETDGPTLVPDEWPPIRSDTPASVRTVRGMFALPGMVLLWFFPKTMGVRLAASGWRPAIAAHLLALTIGAGLIVWAEVFPAYNPVGMAPVTMGRWFFSFEVEYPAPTMTVAEILIGPFAALATLAHASTGLGTGAMQFAWLVPAIAAGVCLLAMALMPFANAGESTKALYGRCVRLVLWCTTLLIPLGVAWLLEPMFCRWLELPNVWKPEDFAGLGLFAIWCLAIMLRSCGRYAGSAEGPAWQPRTPSCVGCGYLVARIPVTTNCPECGMPVAVSLSAHEQSPTDATDDPSSQSPRPHWKARFVAIANNGLFDKPSVHGDPAKQRMSFYTVCPVTALLLSLSLTGVREALGFENISGSQWSDAVVLSCSILIGQIALAGLVAAMIALIRRRTMQSSAVATFHAFSFLLPLAIGVGTVLVGFGLFGFSMERYQDGAIPMTIALALAAAVAVIGGAWIMISAVSRFTRAFSLTRRLS